MKERHEESKPTFPEEKVGTYYEFADGTIVHGLTPKEWRIIDALPVGKDEAIPSPELGMRVYRKAMPDKKDQANTTASINDIFQQKLKTQGLFIGIKTIVSDKKAYNAYYIDTLDKDKKLVRNIELPNGDLFVVKSRKEEIILEKLLTPSRENFETFTNLEYAAFEKEIAAGMDIIEIDERFDTALRALRDKLAKKGYRIKVLLPPKEDQRKVDVFWYFLAL